MRIPRPTIIAVCAFLGACGSPYLPVEGPPVLAKVKPGTGAQVTGKTARIAIRSYMVQGDQRLEVAGARCTVRSPELSTVVTTPAEVVVPTFVQSGDLRRRGKPGDLLVRCLRNGKAGQIAMAATRHPSEATAIQAGNTNPGAPRVDTSGGGAAQEVGGILGNAITGQIFLSFAWTYLYSSGDVTLK